MFWQILSLMVIIIACGRVNFGTAGTTDQQKIVGELETSSLEVEQGGVKELSWHFPCDDSRVDGYDFVGAGSQQQNLANVAELKLQVSGVLCDGQYLPRDVVFVIDTSGSMTNSDPIDDHGSCGRLRAIDHVASYLADFKEARVGLVIYNTYAETLYPQLVSAPEFYANYISDRDNMRELLCKSQQFTNYHRALIKAEQLLTSGRQDSFKEVYFFSDGEPHDTFFKGDPAGLEVAERLRATTTIATIGLGNVGVLEQDIASRVNGLPLHRQAEDLDELFNVLQDLVETKNVGATLSYNYLGTEDTFSIDLWHEAKFDQQWATFNLDPLVFDIDPYDEQKNRGLAITIEYWDNNANTYQAHGELNFIFP